MSEADDDAAAAVTDSIRAFHSVPPFSEEEIIQRRVDNEAWKERQQRRQQESWQRGVETAAGNALVQRQRAALMRQYDEVIAGLERMVNPPQPPPEPEPQIVYVEENQDKRPRSHRWWG
jgi:hypothetical protein